MNLKEIYINYKKTLDNAYMEMHNIIMEDIDNDPDIQLSDDESDELIHDLMLSNMLGEVITHDELLTMQKKAKAYDSIKETYADYNPDYKIIYK